MKKKIALINSAIIFISLMLLISATFFVTYNQNLKNYETRIKEYLTISVETFDGSNSGEVASNLYKINSSIRLSIVDMDGKVLFDNSEAEVFDSHLNRPEIVNLNKVYKRYSNTLKVDMLYIADIDNDHYVRVSLPVKLINSNIYAYASLSLITFIVIIALSITTTFIITNKVFKPINEVVDEIGKISDPEFDKTYSLDDLNEVLESIKSSLNSKIEVISSQNQKIVTIINSLNTGLVVLEDLNIKLINNYALNVFEVNQEILDKNFIMLTRNIELQDLIINCFNNHENKNYLYENNNKFYKIKMIYHSEDFLKNAVIMTIEDITHDYEIQKIKRDLFQNASHELKSPLTSIIGYQQMISMGIVDNKDEIITYTKNTLKEALRMKSILYDMLNLSSLENQKKINFEEINVQSLLENICNDYSLRNKNASIKFVTKLNKCVLNANNELLDQLFRNLIDNAFKYSLKGKIEVFIDQNYFKISDQGIGISKEDQKYIFDRFYKVDKGRTKSENSTGLGLAIVKHICLKLNYKIELNSKLNKGTDITIHFQ